MSMNSSNSWHRLLLVEIAGSRKPKLNKPRNLRDDLGCWLHRLQNQISVPSSVLLHEVVSFSSFNVCWPQWKLTNRRLALHIIDARRGASISIYWLDILSRRSLLHAATVYLWRTIKKEMMQTFRQRRRAGLRFRVQLQYENKKNVTASGTREHGGGLEMIQDSWTAICWRLTAVETPRLYTQNQLLFMGWQLNWGRALRCLVVVRCVGRFGNRFGSLLESVLLPDFLYTWLGFCIVCFAMVASCVYRCRYSCSCLSFLRKWSCLVAAGKCKSTFFINHQFIAFIGHHLVTILFTSPPFP